MNINSRIREIRDNLCGGSNKALAERVGLSAQNVGNWMVDDNPIGGKTMTRITEKLPEINSKWLLTGEGSMLKDAAPPSEKRHIIPLYDDAGTIGGTDHVANMEGVQYPTEHIDAGSWFKEATAAIRHYGDSMTEYPSGCILAVKELSDWESLIVWGRNYVIETSEYRITKRLQKGRDDNHLYAYSSNDETYPDGKLIHEPIDIPKEAIRRIALVLGYVVKHHSSGMVYNTANRQ